MAHILIVEDDVFFIELLEVMLLRAGHQVSMAGDGVAALLWLAEHRADLVITDMVMPNMDGMELIHALKQQYGDMPVIGMSGGQRALPDAFDPQSFQKMGFKTLLQKPFTRAALCQAVELVL